MPEFGPQMSLPLFHHCVESSAGRLHATMISSLTRSGPNGGECVEVADNLPGRVPGRDSKDRYAPVLTFGPEPWRTFVTEVPRR